MIRNVIEVEMQRKLEEEQKQFLKNYDQLLLLDIFSSGVISERRQGVIRELIQQKAEEDVIKSIVYPGLSELEVQEKKKAWMEMCGKNN